MLPNLKSLNDTAFAAAAVGRAASEAVLLSPQHPVSCARTARFGTCSCAAACSRLLPEWQPADYLDSDGLKRIADPAHRHLLPASRRILPSGLGCNPTQP